MVRRDVVCVVMALASGVGACRNYTSIKPSTLPALAADARRDLRGELVATDVGGERFTIRRDFRAHVEMADGTVYTFDAPMTAGVDLSPPTQVLWIDAASGRGRFRAGTLEDVSVSEFSGGKTAGLVLGIIGAVAIGVGIAVAVMLSAVGHIH